MTSKMYTLEEIREAYWKKFHKGGEFWFPYQDEASATDATEGSWEDFCYELDPELSDGNV